MLRALLLSLVALATGSHAAKILVIAPTPSISHQFPFHIVTKALLQRGHRVTFMTTDSLKLTNENYTEIDISAAYSYIRGSFDFVKMSESSPAETVLMISDLPDGSMELQLRDPNVQKFIRSGEKFDLVIIERLGFLGYYGLIHKVGSPPVVGFITQTPPAPVYYSYGNPVNPAFMADMWLGYSDRMDFWQRLYNTFFNLRLMYMWFFELVPKQERIMHEYFGSDLPPLLEMERNFSLLIVNNHFVMEFPRPLLPNIVEITGIHVKTEQNPLPVNIKKFLDEAEQGVIYFSLGSNVRSNSLPEWKRQAFVEAFRELPQRVLWKWENESLPGQPHNLMISKWMPQQDVLAHPNVRLFITQGGLQSLNEATYHAVPLVTIPFFSDQAHNAAKIVRSGIGTWLEYTDVTKDTVLSNIRAVLDDSKYKENMKRLSTIFREHMADSLDRAIWWIEYVLRHNGAKHMRSAALDLYWWQLMLLDVIGFVLLVAATALTVVYFVLQRVFASFKKSNMKVKIK